MNPILAYYHSMPPVTKTYATAVFLTTLALHLDLLHPLTLWLNFWSVWHNYEYWRLITTFLVFDTQFGLNMLFHTWFIIRHSTSLEDGFFRGRVADYLFMWGFMAVLLVGIEFGMAHAGLGYSLSFLAPSLSFGVFYYWSRKHPYVRMNFLFVFDFTAPWLPWVIMAFGFLLGNSPLYDLLGVLVGHLYFYLADVVPLTVGRKILPSLQQNVAL
eukprot:CAMPEP_0177671588 /NCGR_PEP_ID=MMETSP0447-20121125/24805_1 /TAXON_ID=0 /ORGANISM="Stygamoeba regulata, Strain BSH-02190019" /LENGTH=213 /DNA_ID=CAMNT_0019179033 /DNA_START=221 /DNA_END=862 /DNA_ORIENTATION=-